MLKQYAFTVFKTDLKDNILSWIVMVVLFTLIFVFGMYYGKQTNILLLIVSIITIIFFSYLTGVEE